MIFNSSRRIKNNTYYLLKIIFKWESKVRLTFVFIRRINMYHFLKNCFPSLTRKTYNYTVRSPSFQGWVIGKQQNIDVCCCAIFRKGPKIKMGLFAVLPHYQNKGFGKEMYKYLCDQYHSFQWTTNTQKAYNFWIKCGATLIDTYIMDGIKYHLFKNTPIEKKNTPIE